MALLRRGERRSSLFQSSLMQQQQQRFAGGVGAASGNPHILISDVSSLYSVEELPGDLSLRRPSTQSVGAVIVAVCQLVLLQCVLLARCNNRITEMRQY